jgi:hypothetical protein
MNALEASGGFSLQEEAWEQVGRWSSVCQRFLDWQKQHILGSEQLSPDRIEQHRACLKWLLRFGRAIYLTASDPDYPDKRLNKELRGRIIQLEHSWRMMHDQLPDSEAEQLLQEVFPE